MLPGKMFHRTFYLSVERRPLHWKINRRSWPAGGQPRQSLSKVIAAILTKQGVQVTTAVSGEEAFAFVKQNRYDLIFMDIELPGMNGMETTKAIRKWESDRSDPLAPYPRPLTPR